MIKALLISDVHNSYEVAKAAYAIEKPDLVVDCGDHEEISNLFDFTPHLFVHGNHEPKQISIPLEEMPLPFRMQPGQVIEYKRENSKFRFSGIGGNYSSSSISPDNVNLTDIEGLKQIPSGGIDALFLHESPLNVLSLKQVHPLADGVLKEIVRINPKFVFSGHIDRAVEQRYADEKPRFISLGPINSGYGVLSIEGDRYEFTKRVSNWGKSKH